MHFSLNEGSNFRSCAKSDIPFIALNFVCTCLFRSPLKSVLRFSKAFVFIAKVGLTQKKYLDGLTARNRASFLSKYAYTFMIFWFYKAS